MAKRTASATIASMVPATSVAPETAAAAVSAGANATAAQTQATAANEIDWDSFTASPTISVYTRNEAVSVDRELTTPAFIKNSVTFAYEAHQNAEESKRPVWVTLPLGNEGNIEAFMKLARLYCRYKGYTIRGGANPKVTGEARFMVKPKELRTKAK